ALPAGPATDGAVSVTARGPWRRLAVRAGLRTPASGRLRLFGTLDAGAPDLAYRAVAQVGHLNLQGIDGTLPASDLSGRVAGAGALTTLETPLDVRLAPRESAHPPTPGAPAPPVG